MYYKTTNPIGQQVIILIEGNVMTSMVENLESSEWQRYLEWVAAGGISEPWNGA